MSVQTSSNVQPAGRTVDLILESLPVMAWLTDADCRVLWTRGGASGFLGVDASCIAQDVRSIFGHGHPFAIAHQSALAGESRSFDMDWMERSFQVRIQPLRDESGTIVGCIGSGHDVTELKRAERAVTYQAAYDPLTGAFNRAHFRERVERAIVQARRTGAQLTLAVVGIDHFDAINASYGTLTCDDIIRGIASRLAATVPAEVIFARVETDEFELLIPTGIVKHVRDIVDAVLGQFREPFVSAARALRVGASVGTATFPFDGASAEHLCRSAKAATQHARKLGGDRSQFFFPALAIDSVQQIELDHDLWRAVENEEFFLVYQPQISLEDGAIEAMEVLLRWRKDGRVLPASSFIPRLEESSLMVPVGRWIADKALEQFSRWRKQGIDIPRIAINVGARQLRDEMFVATMRRSLERHDVAPHRIDLEITETTAMVNPEMSMATLESLRELGVDITIDDFGAGYSSLNYLRRLPMTGLKIDRSFVADIPDSRVDMAIVEAVIKTAAALEVRLVVEGVEDETQAAWLRNAGCTSAQGYLFSQPLGESAATEFLRRGRIR